MRNATEDEEENAAALEFGKEFDDEKNCLMNKELLVLLQQKSTDSNEFLGNTMDYLRKVTGVSESTNDVRASIAEMRQKLENLPMTNAYASEDQEEMRLHPYEVASLVNLFTQDEVNDEMIDVTIAWIPSLTVYDRESIREALEIIVSVNKRTSMM
jgi:hypothetical protein